MFIFRKSTDLISFLVNAKSNHQKIGFVPTMGALHEGHLTLVKAAQKPDSIVVVSIFVNPTQFNNTEDFAKYPITTEQDIVLLEKNNCDVLFLPSVEDVYPNGTNNLKYYDLGKLAQILEGEFRPGHYQGVANVVSILLDIVQPDILYLGQKDYQQCKVIARLMEIESIKSQLNIVPTSRAADGLALSSRNARLNAAQRALAPVIYQCLVSVQAQKGIKPLAVVKKECWELLEQKGFKPEYIELAESNSLELLNEYSDQNQSVVLLAAWLGDVRLIDCLEI